MFKSFVVAVEIVVLVMILRSSFVQYLLADLQADLSNWMTEISMLAEREQMDDLKHAILPFTSDLKEYQQDYLDDVFSQLTKLKAFHRNYCVNKDKNPYIYGARLRNICQKIEQSRVLLDD